MVADLTIARSRQRLEIDRWPQGGSHDLGRLSGEIRDRDKRAEDLLQDGESNDVEIARAQARVVKAEKELEEYHDKSNTHSSQKEQRY